MKQQSVTQFIIVPPISRLAQIVAHREVLADWLTKRFPRYSFEIAGLAPIQDDEHFVVIPIMNFQSPDGDSFMCMKPETWLMADIAKACAEFEPGELSSFAA